MAYKRLPPVDDAAVTKRLQDEFATLDPIVHVILKAHLLVEDSLNKIISKFVFHPERLEDARLSFYQRFLLARSMSLDESDNRMWGLIGSLNTLRNDLAHGLESPKRQEKIDAVKKIYFEICADHEGIEQERQMGDLEILAFAGTLSVGFLSSFEKELDRYRSHVNMLDKLVNSHRHPKKAKR
jgi:hypothetical protein